LKEAAAAEMRARIIEATRRRAASRPGDVRLRRQAALCEAAHISTIHAFCLWLVRRWFTHVDLDPSVTVLDGDEEKLVQREVMEGLFGELYGSVNESAGDGADGSSASRAYAGGGLGRRFERLVNEYGLGSDADVAAFVLRLASFLGSLPEPEGWMRDAVSSLQNHPDEVVARLSENLGAELDRQIEFCDEAAVRISSGDPAGLAYEAQIGDYARFLRECVTSHERGAAGFEGLRRQLAGFSFPRLVAPRLGKDADAARVAARDTAKALREEVKARLFEQRLRKRFCLFSRDEWRDGLRRTAPYVATLTELAQVFRRRYGERKRRLGVVDFADLERLAFDLLRRADDPDLPSDVARALHRRFKYVLVDEFQDINPIQEAILKLASHESDVDRPGNLFVVGDVKQSIYRFRLAEPGLFLKRLRTFAADGGGTVGRTILLQENFRSRASILDAVNLVFSSVMRGKLGSADVVYDERAHLRAGTADRDGERGAAVELHLLERGGRAARALDAEGNGEESGESACEPESGERGVAAWNDPSRWEPIEREAYLIGRKIEEWRERRTPVVAGGPPAYRDVAILLRATKINAERMAVMLGGMGVPAYADVGGSLFGAREVRDVLAALQVLDNVQQDIPLAAVLRSGVLGEPFSADELMEIRSLDRKVPFHSAVRAYRDRGSPLA
jgi:ATP-dependent helicase/nuclease subunit A